MLASSKLPGRIPAISTVRSPIAADHSSRIGTDVNGIFNSSPSTDAGTMFIGGDPMNPATNRFTGCSYNSRGLATCCRIPRRRTATRSPRVIASV